MLHPFDESYSKYLSTPKGKYLVSESPHKLVNFFTAVAQLLIYKGIACIPF